MGSMNTGTDNESLEEKWVFFESWIQNGSARVGLKSRPGVDFISTGSADQNRTDAQCLTNT